MRRRHRGPAGRRTSNASNERPDAAVARFLARVRRSEARLGNLTAELRADRRHGERVRKLAETHEARALHAQNRVKPWRVPAPPPPAVHSLGRRHALVVGRLRVRSGGA